MLFFYQNNQKRGIFQWGIDKNNKFSLEPSKYYSGNYSYALINDEYIVKWLKYYQRWNWVFVKDNDKISKIEDKDIQALQIEQEYKNNPIISEYIKRQINFQPDKYNEFLQINLINPEKVDYKQYNEAHNSLDKFYHSESYKKFNDQQEKIINEINKLKKTEYIFQKTKILENKTFKIGDKKYTFFADVSIPSMNYVKYYKYQKYIEIPRSPISLANYNIYNNLLFKEPNLFSDGNYKSETTELINPKHVRKEDEDFIVDYSSKLTEQEAQKLGKDPWINPIPEYKKWFSKWKEVLPNIINKNWDDKTKIKAIAYYIATNTTYLAPVDKNFNYNGYGFYNPAQIFTNDPEIQCVGYSMNLAAALTILNIPVRIMTGEYLGEDLATISNSGHAWNEVKVDGRWKAIDLTNWDSYEINNTFELKDDTDLFLERNSEWMNQFRLKLSSYETTIMFYQNPKEYEYQDLPDSL
ncbi:transglutaminase-like domain-containing protein [Mycoplasma sp. 1578d]|nr:transglutaminase-like domain-containing protein [Mycoplasma sp. 1578d]UUM19740.1 transglutaminase-like domain-containing protein [Mycoplasma sp. 1578d]